jgi:hypothetical protein
MLLRALLAAVTLAMAGCATLVADPVEQLRNANKLNLAKVSPGMTRSTVESVMGDARAGGGLTDVMFGRVQYLEAKNPMREEQVRSSDGAEYLVLFYYTDVHERDDKITDDELTPVAFRDGKVVGIGYGYLGRRVAKYKQYVPQ